MDVLKLSDRRAPRPAKSAELKVAELNCLACLDTFGDVRDLVLVVLLLLDERRRKNENPFDEVDGVGVIGG